MGDKIYLWDDLSGWASYDLDDETTLSTRGISICAKATIGDGANIGDGATIRGGAKIGDGANIGYRATIGYGANIGYWATIGDRATIGDGAKIGDGATIGDGENPTIIYIVGSCHAVAYWGEDRVDIGCISKSIDAWLDGPHAGLIRDNGYTKTQVDEYRQYVGMIRDIHYAVKGGE